MNMRQLTVLLSITALTVLYGFLFAEEPVSPVINEQKAQEEKLLKEALARLEETRQKYAEKAKTTKAGFWVKGYETRDMELVAQYHERPECEAILEQLSKIGPVIEYEGRTTVAKVALENLRVVRDKREFVQMMKDIDKPEDRVKKVREFFDKHPDLLAASNFGTPKRPIVKMLLDEAERLQGGDVVDLLVLSQLYGNHYFTQYKDALLEYAKKLGREKAVATPYLLQYLAATGNTNAVPVLEEWFKEAPDGEVMDALSELPNAKTRLRTWLKDPRPGVARNAASWLVLVAADEDSIKAVNELIDQLRKSGASKGEITFYEGTVKSIRQMMAGGTHAP